MDNSLLYYYTLLFRKVGVNMNEHKYVNSEGLLFEEDYGVEKIIRIGDRFLHKYKSGEIMLMPSEKPILTDDDIHKFLEKYPEFKGVLLLNNDDFEIKLINIKREINTHEHTPLIYYDITGTESDVDYFFPIGMLISLLLSLFICVTMFIFSTI